MNVLVIDTKAWSVAIREGPKLASGTPEAVGPEPGRLQGRIVMWFLPSLFMTFPILLNGIVP